MASKYIPPQKESNLKRVKPYGFFWLGSKKHKEYHILINVLYKPSIGQRIRMFLAGYNFTKL